jgi:uncharacterized protein
MKRFSLVLFLLFLGILFTSAIPVYAKTRFITIGTGGRTGVYYPTGTAIAKIINLKRKELGIRCKAESTTGSVYNVDAVMEGRFQFGIVQSDRQYQAVKGIAEWKDKGPQKKLRALFSIYPESCSLIAAVDARVNSVSDLVNKSVNLGEEGSGHLGNSLDILSVTGLNPVTDLKAMYINPEDAPSLLQDQRIDAFFYTVGHPSDALKEATSGARRVKFVSIAGDEIDYLVKSRPYYSRMKIPIKYYPGAQNSRDVSTFGVCATLVTSSEVDEEVVYALTKTVFEGFEELKALHATDETFTKNNMLECLTAPLHPGALKYYREIGLGQ